MPYNHAFLAKKLCDSNHDIISTFLLANKKKHIANYLSSCAEAGFARYDGTTGNLVDAEYLIYDEDNLTIRIEVANQAVRGLVGKEELYRRDLTGEVAEALFQISKNWWKEERKYVTLDKPGDQHTLRTKEMFMRSI